jgi:hypothetical protein
VVSGDELTELWLWVVGGGLAEVWDDMGAGGRCDCSELVGWRGGIYLERWDDDCGEGRRTATATATVTATAPRMANEREQ